MLILYWTTLEYNPKVSGLGPFDGERLRPYNQAMRRVNWTITEGQHRALKRLSQQTGLSISELVRRAIDKYIGLLGEEPQPQAEPQLRPGGLRSEVTR